MTEEFLCSAATEDFRCCYATDLMEFAISICYATAADYFYPDLQCGETIYNIEMGEYTFWTVRCPWPPPTDPPAGPKGQTSPEAIDGATVGTIVVASLIGVALVGGAIAVHLQV